MAERPVTSAVHDSEAGLEQALMEEYLSDRGYTFDDLDLVDDVEREGLMVEAAAYAALRLAELA